MAKDKRQRIKVTKEQECGHGAYQVVYKISPQRIVKVPNKLFSASAAEKVVRDEVRGSKLWKFALPVLRVVDVILPDGYIRVGTVRRFIPFSVCGKMGWDQWLAFARKHKIHRGWDSKDTNYRVDSKGRYWRVDTQTRAAYKIREQ